MNNKRFIKDVNMSVTELVILQCNNAITNNYV